METDVLIGMDIISNSDFAVTNRDGKTTFSFAMPSISRIDFSERLKDTKITNRGIISPKGQLSTVPKVGRNVPCPCGSGKKYKNCHGKAA